MNDDGTISIQFEALPPFFAEDNGTEAEFENFDRTMADALGVSVRREDRELFVIDAPAHDTRRMVKDWLENYRSNDA